MRSAFAQIFYITFLILKDTYDVHVTRLIIFSDQFLVMCNGPVIIQVQFLFSEHDL